MKKQEATLFTFHILYHQCLLDIEQFIYSVNIELHIVYSYLSFNL